MFDRADRDTLVLVFLRGGMDALSFCVPYGDADYYRWRPTLSLPEPQKSNGVIDLDGFFGLHPAANALLPFFRGGQLAIVHAIGSPLDIRSHFEAMLRIESGSPRADGNAVPTGWIARHMLGTAARGSGTLRGLAVDPVLPRSFVGAPASLAIYDPSGFAFPGYESTAGARAAALRAMYASRPTPTGGGGIRTLEAIDVVRRVPYAAHQPRFGAQYPSTDFGRRLKDAAAAVIHRLPVDVLEVDRGDWDDHDDMGPATGKLAQRIAELSNGLAAFATDLGPDLRRCTLLVMSEFGRRVDENGSAGTDHGRAGLMLALGQNVVGAKVHRQWPGLAPQQLDDFALRVTIDWRDVVGEVLTKRCGLPPSEFARVFPQHVPNFPGIISA